MAYHFVDDLLEAIADKGSPVCVGIDPVYDKLPEEYRPQVDDEVEHTVGIGNFCQDVLELIAPIVPAVKIQSAYFERYGATGVDLYEQLIDRAHDLDLLVIGDVKRNDIGSTAAAYAEGHLRGLMTKFGPDSRVADAVTVNGYFGADGIKPFVDMAEQESRGVFVLVRTSNPTAKDIQDFTNAAGLKFYEHMAAQVAAIGSAESLIGDRGYSCVGAVVGATWPQEARQLRQLMPQQLFLVPGYGAQGATATDCAAAFKADGTGAIVNASRSVLFAFHDTKYAGLEWRLAIQDAARLFAADIAAAVKHA